MSHPADRQWLRVDQVAQRLNLHPDTVRKLVREGYLRRETFKGTRVKRIPLSSVQSYERSCCDAK